LCGNAQAKTVFQHPNMRGDNTPTVLLAGTFCGVVTSWKGKVPGPTVPVFLVGINATTVTKTGPSNVKVVVVGVTCDGLVDEEAFAPTGNTDESNVLSPAPLETALRGADFGIGSLVHTIMFDHTNLTRFPSDSLPSEKTRACWKKWYDRYTEGATAAADDDERIGTRKRVEHLKPIERFAPSSSADDRGITPSPGNSADSKKRPRDRSASPINRPSSDRASSLAASRQALQLGTLEEKLKAARTAGKEAAAKHALVTKQLKADQRKSETKMAKAQKELDKLAAQNSRLATENSRLENELRLQKERSKSPLNPPPAPPKLNYRDPCKTRPFGP